MTKKYIGYVRVSTKKQTQGKGIEIQKEAIKSYCKAHNLTLEKTYSDLGLSGYKNREGREKALNRLFTDPEIHGIVCYDLTRFARSTADLLNTIIKIEEIEKQFITTKDNFDNTTKTGKLLFGLLSLIADFEAETIKERMTAGREYAMIHGTKSTKPMHRPEKLIDWDYVKKSRNKGLSWSWIARDIKVSNVTLLKRARKKGVYEKWGGRQIIVDRNKKGVPCKKSTKPNM